MTYRIDYELKTDKNGHKYALKINLKSGKKERIPYKVAQKRQKNLIYSRAKATKVKVITDKLRETGSGATYKDYTKALSVVENEIRQKRIKDGKEPLNESIVRSRAKKRTIEHRTGMATRYRFAWTYTVKLGTYVNNETKAVIVDCDSPIFEAGKDFMNGNEFGRLKNDKGYHGFIGVCEEVLDDILSLDLCTLDGGACIVYYDKLTKDIIKNQEFGRGCGFKFDFKNYHEDQNILTKMKNSKRI